MQRGCVCPLHHCFSPFFNLPLEIVVVTITIFKNTDDNRAAARVGPRFCSTRLGRWGQDRGSPRAGKVSSILGCFPGVSRPCQGWELGLVPRARGDVPSDPPSLPGDAPGGTSSILPAKRIGFLQECEKAPAEPIPAAISDNKALY